MNLLNIGILLSYLCIASLSATIITPALSAIEQSFQLGHGAVEWVMSIFLLGYVIGQLIYGPIANRYGRLAALRLGLGLNLVGIVCCLMAASFLSYPMLLLGRFITAIGSAAGLTCTFILINELLSEADAKKAMSYAIISFTLGIGVAVSGGGLLTQLWSWQACFYALLLHGLLMYGLTYRFQETLQKASKVSIKAIALGYLSALTSPRLIAFSLSLGLCSAISYCYATAAPLYAQKVLHLTSSQYGYWNGLNMLGMLASGLLGASLMKRISAERVLASALALLTTCIAALIWLYLHPQSNPLWFFVTTTLLYLYGGLLFPAASFLASRAIECKANASAVMSFINIGSAMLAVIVMGYLPMNILLAFALTLSGFFVVVCLSLLLQGRAASGTLMSN